VNIIPVSSRPVLLSLPAFLSANSLHSSIPYLLGTKPCDALRPTKLYSLVLQLACATGRFGFSKGVLHGMPRLHGLFARRPLLCYTSYCCVPLLLVNVTHCFALWEMTITEIVRESRDREIYTHIFSTIAIHVRLIRD
jgi:hypothetical protein